MKKYIGFAVMLLLAVSNFAIAEQSEALNWLSDQQGVNGSVYLESDVANADQSTYEAAQALSNSVDSRFSANIARASAFLNDSDATTLSTESLSRRILLKASASLELDQDVQELLSRRSARGGYGDYADVPPSILSTAFSLRALGSVGVPADGQTIQYLLNQQQADGSWSFPILGEPSVELTAYAMNSLWMYRNELNLNASLDSAQAFLETQIDSVTNLWATTEASALVLIALLERNVDRSAYQTSIDTLISQQLANGSYENDVYLTGLISRLIEIANEPANDAISISGRVLDGDSGLPLPSVNVQLTGSGDTGVSTGSDGRFTLSIDLAGSYQLAFVLDSYGKAMLQTTLADGDQQTLNDVILTKLAEDPDTGDPVTTGTVRGNVSASINGEPLAGVLIIVNNQTGLSATTDSQGNYLITNVSEGPITTEASLDGYQSLSGGANISSNQTLIFSPELSEIVPSTATVFGSVKDAVSGDLLEGSTVTVTVNGSDFVSTTDLSGSYQIVDVPSGPISYSATLEDYQTVSGSLNALDGANINFSPALQPTPVIEEPITNGIVSGNVTNSQSGAPLLGVVVTVNDQASLSATTDAQGSYLIANVPIGVVTVVASIDGFQSATSAASIAENQTLTFSPALTEVIPSSVTLFGSVKDSVSGNLLEGSTITATVNGSDFLATTDQNGVYQISGVPSGLISFTAARSGYQTASGSLNGLDGQRANNNGGQTTMDTHSLKEPKRTFLSRFDFQSELSFIRSSFRSSLIRFPRGICA